MFFNRNYKTKKCISKVSRIDAVVHYRTFNSYNHLKFTGVLWCGKNLRGDKMFPLHITPLFYTHENDFNVR